MFEDFSDYLPDFYPTSHGWGQNEIYTENLISAEKVQKVIKELNKKSSSVLGDLPMKVIQIFSEELSKARIQTFSFLSDNYISCDFSADFM